MARFGTAVKWLVAGLVFFAATPEAALAQAQWGASVKVDTVWAPPGGRVGVPVRLINNAMEYSGLQIPLQMKNPYLTFDSVSLAGSIITPDFDLLVQLPPGGANTMEMTVLQRDFQQYPLPAMPAIDGVIATVWVTVAEGAPLGMALIDSLAIDTMIGPEGNQVRYWRLVNGSDRQGTTIMPGFIPGGVRVEQGTAVADESEETLPEQFALGQNYPNPFNPSTVIGFALPQASEIRLSIFNLLGQEVATVAEGPYSAGRHEVTFDASDRPSGVYFYRLSYSGGEATRKMLLVK